MKLENINCVPIHATKITSNLNVDIPNKSVWTNHRGKKRHCRFDASYHRRQNDRCPEIAFSGHKNAENEHNEKLKK